MTFDFSKLKISTKALIGFLLSLGSFLQIPAVSAPVFAFVKTHPHWASALAVLTGVVGLLHNPQVEAFFNYKATTKNPDGSVTDKTVSVTLPCVNCGVDPTDLKPNDGAPKQST